MSLEAQSISVGIVLTEFSCVCVEDVGQALTEFPLLAQCKCEVTTAKPYSTLREVLAYEGRSHPSMILQSDLCLQARDGNGCMSNRPDSNSYHLSWF